MLVAASFLGGSTFWHLIGLGQTLDIEGEARVVRSDPGDLGTAWRAYGGDPGGNRYVAAGQIDRDNVSSLRIAWTHRSGALAGRPDSDRANSAFQATPILVADALVYCTQFQQVIAIDPGTGTEKWRFDPQVPSGSYPGNQYTCRGVSYWADDQADSDADCAERIFLGTVDARIIALDARTGKPCEAFGTEGQLRIEPSLTLRWPGEFQITSAPAIVGDIVVTGTSISDNLRTDAPEGTVFAFDARDGEPRWTFDPLEASPEIRGNHANVWSTISVDEERGLVFLPTSSPSPDYFGGNRAGDNRYANSLVALDGESGTVAWHFQAVHHDVWDYDLPAQPGLYEVWRDGRLHEVVAQVTKTGHVFVLDRETGEPFLPIEERPVPQAGVNGERLSPTQPFPALTPAIVPDRLDPDDAFGLTVWDKLACRSKLASLRAEGLYTPPSLEGTLAYPFQGGGANWGSTAYDPSRNLMVVNMNNLAGYVRLHRGSDEARASNRISESDEFAPMEGAPYSMSRDPLVSPLGLPCSPPPWGVLAGVDLDSGAIVWRRTLGTTEELAGGLALELGTPALGGPMITGGGLVFIGAAMDNYLRAFDVATGRELWKGRLPAGGQATPMSYVWQGRQYVVIAAGGHSRVGTKPGDHLVAFALPGN
nr:pyrroloquinoline quinone-dependent dehydrogenase [Qipengyuania polymorpha]